MPFWKPKNKATWCNKTLSYVHSGSICTVRWVPEKIGQYYRNLNDNLHNSDQLQNVTGREICKFSSPENHPFYLYMCFKVFCYKVCSFFFCSPIFSSNATIANTASDWMLDIQILEKKIVFQWMLWTAFLSSHNRTRGLFSAYCNALKTDHQLFSVDHFPLQFLS